MKWFEPETWGLRFFLGIAALLVALNLFGPNGFVRWLILEQEIKRSKDQQTELANSITKLSSELEQFQSSQVVQERTLRETLGVLRKDEASLELIPTSTPDRNAKAPRRR